MLGKEITGQLPHFSTEDVTTPLFNVVREVLFGMLRLVGLLDYLDPAAHLVDWAAAILVTEI